MSLKLYYTGATKFDKPQPDAIRSIGGFIASSEVPNGMIGNLFGDLSRYAVQEGRAEIRVIAIKNVAVTTKVNLKCWFSYPNDGAIARVDTNDCEYEIGFVSPTPDNCGDLMSEKLQSIYAAPMTVTLAANKVTELTALALGPLDAGDYLCIYIRRKIKASAQQQMSDADLLAILNETKTLPKVEDIGLVFAWD